MKKQTKKIKNWYEEHKDEIDGVKSKVVRAGCCIAGLGVGYFVGKKYTELKLGIGCELLHSKGIMKFVNPETGLDISLHEACELAKQK